MWGARCGDKAGPLCVPGRSPGQGCRRRTTPDGNSLAAGTARLAKSHAPRYDLHPHVVSCTVPGGASVLLLGLPLPAAAASSVARQLPHSGPVFAQPRPCSAQRPAWTTSTTPSTVTWWSPCRRCVLCAAGRREAGTLSPMARCCNCIHARARSQDSEADQQTFNLHKFPMISKSRFMDGACTCTFARQAAPAARGHWAAWLGTGKYRTFTGAHAYALPSPPHRARATRGAP